MIRLGLIGKKLGHSYSKKLFEEMFAKMHIDGKYELYELQTLENIAEFTKVNQIDGFNVTIPYKEEIINYLHWCDECAKSVGAVNTVKVVNEEMYGYNTDVIGFDYMLQKAIKTQCKHCYDNTESLILGTGGAAKAVAAVMKKYGYKITFASRQQETKEWIREIDANSITYNDIDSDWLRNKAKIIVNTTPLGMYPNIDECPLIDYKSISEYHIVLDLVYNPQETKFLKNCAKGNAYCSNGLEMLQKQGEAAFDIFLSKESHLKS